LTPSKMYQREALLHLLMTLLSAFYGHHDTDGGGGIDVNSGPDPSIAGSQVTPEEWLILNGTGKFLNNYRQRGGGYKDFLCPTDANSVLFGECETDCWHNHGAAKGTSHCGDPRKGDYTCYCGKPIQKVEPESLHCSKKTQAYQDICKMDCICNHASKGGYCNFKNKACVCQRQGKNKKNKGCVAQDWHSFTEYVRLQIGEEGLNYVGKPYHWFVKKDVPFPQDPKEYLNRHD